MKFVISIIYTILLTSFTSGHPQIRARRSGDIKILNFETCTAPERKKVIPTMRYGQTVKKGSYPWHTSIFNKNIANISNSNQICGGSLFSKDSVLTAAHCMFNRDEKSKVLPDSLFVIFDLLMLRVEGTIYEVRTVIVHEWYNPKIFLHDIALLKLQNEVEFTNFIRPVCITNENFDIFNDNVVGYVSSKLL